MIVIVAVGCRGVAIGGFGAPLADMLYRVAKVGRAVRIGHALEASPRICVAERRNGRAIRGGPAAGRRVRRQTDVTTKSASAATPGAWRSRVRRAAEERDLVRRAAARRYDNAAGDGNNDGNERESASRTGAHPCHERPFTGAEHRRTPHPRAEPARPRMAIARCGGARRPWTVRRSHSRRAATVGSAPRNR